MSFSSSLLRRGWPVKPIFSGFLSATLDGTSITIADSRMSPSIYKAGSFVPDVWLVRIVTPFDLRGRGAATRALRDIMAASDEAGVSLAFAAVADQADDQERLTNLYRRLGFQQISQEHFAYGAAVPDVGLSM